MQQCETNIVVFMRNKYYGIAVRNKHYGIFCVGKIRGLQYTLAGMY